ncbi:DUF5990 family protein [Micromonospora sp. HK10]|uniref:DUF5990 family protein n=1 Tax=Micromonospora sp. HK10 TaxID=1538294 RepID=UPI000626F724|nr:DUF5990 family protein [Micromonospora sp. HK10]KKK05313.1 hypothetical protein LQ51_14785 [Micromonospora sp. HK10]
MRIRLEGEDLPGRRAGVEADRLRLGNVQVGVQCRAEVVERVPADAPQATWQFEVTSREVDGLLDVGGPWVHGRPGARFLYLSWGAVTDDRFEMFRRAKLLFGDVPTDLLRAAHDGAGTLVGRLRLTGTDGGPVCARVRPPDITWSVERRAT